MKILSLLFCFMFLDCFSIFHLNIWWAFLWPHLVTSHFSPLQSPSSFYSGLQAWLQLIFRVHVCVTCPDSTAPSYISQLWAPLGAVMTVSVYCLPILWLLILFAHKFMSAWRGKDMSFCEEPGTDSSVIMNVCWMNDQTQYDWPEMFASVTLSLLLLERVKWWCSVWSWCQADTWVCTMLMSPWCEECFILICVHSLERGHSPRALELMPWMSMIVLKSVLKLLFLGRKFPRFWKVPTLEEWIWHHFLLQAKSWFTLPSSPMSSLTTWSQPAKCLWWWRCSRLCGSRAPSTSPWPSRGCQRLLSASEESRFGEK